MNKKRLWPDMLSGFWFGICCVSLLWVTAVIAEDAPIPGLSPALSAPKAAQERLLDITSAGNRLIAVGQHGVILTSNDGNSWQQTDSPVSLMLTRVHFTDAKNGWALGYDETMLRTTDGGNNWKLAHHNPRGRALFDMQFLDAQNGIAVGGYGTHLVTRDGGQSWSFVESPLYDVGMHLNEILVLGDGTLFVAGERGMMARSTDNGETWEVLDGPYGGSSFGALPYGEKGVVIFGMRGNVFRTGDVSACATADAETWDSFEREVFRSPETIAALGWEQLETPTLESLFGGAYLDNGQAVLVGVNGTVLRLDNESGQLEILDVPAAETLVKVTQFNGRVLAVGRRGIQDLQIGHQGAEQ